MTADDRDMVAGWRNRALAELAHQRDRVFQQITGLDEQTLVALPVQGNWSAKDVLAHLAAWDRRFVSGFNDALAGKRLEEADFIPDPYNEAVFAERRGWPLDRVLAECLAARAAVIDAINGTPDEALTLDRGLPWGDGTLRYWLAPRAHHDLEHAADLTAWRQRLGPGAQTTWHDCGPKSVLLAAMDVARAALLAEIALIPAEQRETRTVVGVWTLSAVVGHIADWEWLDVRVLADLLAGDEPGAAAVEDVDAWNAAHAAARAGEPWPVAWRDFTSARAGLLAVLGEMDDRALNTPRGGVWAGRPYRWAYVCLDHDRTHAADLRGGH